MKKEFIENKHYYLEEGRVVFTALYLLDRGWCCGNKCRHCPYSPKYQKGTKEVEKDLVVQEKNTNFK